MPGVWPHDHVYLPGLRLRDSVYLTCKFELVSSLSMYRVMVTQKDLQVMLHLSDPVSVTRWLPLAWL